MVRLATTWILCAHLNNYLFLVYKRSQQVEGGITGQDQTQACTAAKEAALKNHNAEDHEHHRKTTDCCK